MIPGMIQSTAAELSALFREHGEDHLADRIDHTMQLDRDELPEGILEMFRHGMGGLLDRGSARMVRTTSRRLPFVTRLADQLYTEGPSDETPGRRLIFDRRTAPALGTGCRPAAQRGQGRGTCLRRYRWTDPLRLVPAPATIERWR